jgi:sigma-B regulation protein RsbU (phosphoserine phosphatase)
MEKRSDSSTRIETRPMTKRKLHHLKNEMLGANCFANLVTVAFVQVLMFKAEVIPDAHVDPRIWVFDDIFTPAAFVVVCLSTFLYEQPIRQYLNRLHRNETIRAELVVKARRRLLNEPFFAIAMDLAMWLLAAVVYPLLFWLSGAGAYMAERSLFMSLSTGLITVTIAFFLLEHVMQKRLAPYFFPAGGLSAVPRTLRIRIQTRLVALLFACNLIPLFSVLHIFHRITKFEPDPTVALDKLRSALFINCFVFMAVAVWLTMLVSKNLSSPFAEIIQTLRSVRNGNFNKKVRVISNDEIGYTADVINEMTEGLQERERMRRSLGLAMEVQRSLMPKTAPQVHGLDIAGLSLYCEETGGDYYDYLEIRHGDRKCLAIIVGDVSDHGVPSALLMTTARAFLRQRAAMGGSLDHILADVNRQLCHDVQDSGQFMTAFLAEFDRDEQTMRWATAGHDPALIYDPVRRTFDELPSSSLPLGVFDDAVFTRHERSIAPGQILLVGTDGIWESRNAEDRMFGKERFKKVVETHADQPSRNIIAAVINALNEFRGSSHKEDDVTLVVVKVDA